MINTLDITQHSVVFYCQKQPPANRIDFNLKAVISFEIIYVIVFLLYHIQALAVVLLSD